MNYAEWFLRTREPTAASDNVVIGNNSNLPVPFGPLDIDRTTPYPHSSLVLLRSRFKLKNRSIRGPKDKEANEHRGTADLWIRLSISEIAFSPSVGRSVGQSMGRSPLSATLLALLYLSRDRWYSKIRQKSKTEYNLFLTIDGRLWSLLAYYLWQFLFRNVPMISWEFKKVILLSTFNFSPYSQLSGLK